MPRLELKSRDQSGDSHFEDLADLQARHQIISAIEGRIVRITGIETRTIYFAHEARYGVKRHDAALRLRSASSNAQKRCQVTALQSRFAAIRVRPSG